MITEQQQIYLELAGVKIADIISPYNMLYTAIKAALYTNSYTNDCLQDLLNDDDEAWETIAVYAQDYIEEMGLKIDEITRWHIVDCYGLYNEEELVELLAGANMTAAEKLAYWEDNLL